MDSRPNDETLLLAVADRDMGAFRTLYERHAGWLAIRLARRCNDRDLVADAIQDTFVAVWQKPQGFRGDGDIAAWLWGIAIRRLVSRLRTRGSVAAVFEKAETAPAAEDQVLLSVEYGDIGQALARLSPEMRAVIQAVVLDGLSAKEAEAVTLTAWHGLEPADAARAAGCSRTAFIVRLHRGRRRLARALEASHEPGTQAGGRALRPQVIQEKQ